MKRRGFFCLSSWDSSRTTKLPAQAALVTKGRKSSTSASKVVFKYLVRMPYVGDSLNVTLWSVCQSSISCIWCWSPNNSSCSKRCKAAVADSCSRRFDPGSLHATVIPDSLLCSAIWTKNSVGFSAFRKRSATKETVLTTSPAVVMDMLHFPAEISSRRRLTRIVDSNMPFQKEKVSSLRLRMSRMGSESASRAPRVIADITSSWSMW
mmetsp:Transcript_61432/g.146460  ORF Transcript_61432/g.146460 Transcript_61432/m.146460 type:complete len:208 (-) Transcript_61432:1871-2494(-)